ncbi:hypothetical protein [Algibacter sp. L4_22]|uniref:TapB family protein n=1 Tax=Algibacter sp. L4_22 TaxID=2942477 RepID=UPI00201B4FAA|nr:hypothetical protein [Algibacter sp. L4_22]MCL5129832.1 hypothetical protein [Algibacter sp. L4_22]
MKKVFSISIFLLIFQLTYSQTCENISPYKKGMSMEYTNYNKKGKIQSVENHFIESVTNEEGSLNIKIKSSEGKKAKNEREYILKCVNGDFYVDMSNYTSLQNEDQKDTFKVKATGDFIEFPEGMKVGTVLEDGNIALEVGSGASFAPMANMKVLNRTVLENKSLTIKAGTFDGYKISFDYVFDLGLLKFRGSGIEWYVKGIGIVKSENYSKKGKLRSYRELTKINNN